MLATRHGLVIGSVIASLGHVWSIRQKVSTEIGSTALADAIGSLMQQHSSGTEDLLNRISAFAGSAVTPGAANSYETSLKAVVQHIESRTEKDIKLGQVVTQTKLSLLFKGLEGANSVANTAKTSAEAGDKTWFECVADEQTKLQVAEAKERSLATSRINEKEACQQQQDAAAFAFDATGKYKLDFACDFMKQTCVAALQTFNTTTIQKMHQDATATLQQAKATYNKLKANCDKKTQERVQAQHALDSAESAWSTQKATCEKLGVRRHATLCAFGFAAQAKCKAESIYNSSVAATQSQGGFFNGVFSEVDRKTEWESSQTVKCMIGRFTARSLNSALDKVDMAACAANVNFDQDVGKLNLRQGELAKLGASNKCSAGTISFHNSLTWNVPAGRRPLSSGYTQTAWTPTLDPSTGNFQFCSLSAIWGAFRR